MRKQNPLLWQSYVESLSSDEAGERWDREDEVVGSDNPSEWTNQAVLGNGGGTKANKFWIALTWHDSTRVFAKRDSLPAVEQTLAQLLGAKILSKLDINTADTSIPWKCTADYLHNPVRSILFSMIAVRNHLHTRTLSVTYVRPVEWLRWSSLYDWWHILVQEHTV